jgi:hypothetical protein
MNKALSDLLVITRGWKRKISAVVAMLPMLLTFLGIHLPEPWTTYIQKAAMIVWLLGWADAGWVSMIKNRIQGRAGE